jgi:LPXTG-motif cell wall-anchored protein
MLAIVAAILFAIAWIINATGTATNAWFSVTGLLLLGLACLALHQAGIGSAWVRRRSRPPCINRLVRACRNR